MGTVTINGHTYDVGPDDVVLVIGNKVHFNFKLVGETHTPEAKIEGDPLNVHSIGAVRVTGNVQGDVETQGSVTCQNVGQGVSTQGRVECGTVAGGINTQGSVEVTGDCGNINTMGSVKVGGSCKGKIDTMGKVVVGSR